MVHKETRELVRSSDAHVDTETGSASEHLGAPTPAGAPHPKATIVAVSVVALSLGIVGFIGISSVQKPIERAPPISWQSASVGSSDFPTGKTQNRSRMGCSNWHSIALTLPALLGHSQDSCDKLCSSTKGCFYSNFQASECQGDDGGVAPGACYLFGPGCKLQENNCWDLNVVPGPPAFKLEKARTGCSNWLHISLQESKQVENMFRCSTECTAVNCSMFVFAPENGSCHVLKDSCTEVENAEHDLYRAIPTVSEYTWAAESSEAPHHEIVVNDVAGFAATTKFFMLYPNMHAEPFTVVQTLPKMNTIMFAPALHETAFEGSVLFITAAPDGPPIPALTASDAPTATACWPAGTEVRVVPGSRYDDGSTGGSCALIGQPPLCSDEPRMLTFGNNFKGEYQHSDVEPFVCPTAAPTSVPTSEPTSISEPTSAPTPACIPYQVELTTDVMDQLCTPGSYDEDRSPTAIGCDPAITSAVRLALANGMFKPCGAWCLFDVDQPASVAYHWKGAKSCWARDDAKCLNRQGEVNNAVERSGSLCLAPAPTDSPTVSPTAVPTAAPTEAATCTWATQTSTNRLLGCVDGTFCSANTDGWACCADNLGRAQCPPDLPVMCNSQTCGGGDYCCESDCSNHGGDRPCAAR